MTRKEVLDQLCDLISGGIGQVPEGEEAALLRELIGTLTIMAVAYEAAEEGVDAEVFATRILDQAKLP